MQTPRYSVKQTDFLVLLVPGLYIIHSIMRTLAGLLPQGCLAPLIGSPSRHYTNTGTRNSSLWLSFLAIVHAARESSGTRLCSAQRHKYTIATPTGNIPETSEHFFTQNTLDGTNGVRIMRFHSINVCVSGCACVGVYIHV